MPELEREIGSTGFPAGWHDGLEMQKYLDDPAVSASALWTLDQNTPAHLLDELRGPRETTDAKELGSVVHTAVFEADQFDSRYVVMGQCEAFKKKDGERCTNAGSRYRDGSSFCGTKGHDPYGDEPTDPNIHAVPESDRNAALKMKAALFADPTAGELLSAEGRREVTGFWKDPVTGLWCRIRPDLLIDEPQSVNPAYHFSTANLKTTGKSAHPERYWRDAEKMGTEFKAAFYLMGLRELCGWEPQNFFYPVVETNGSHQVIVFRMDDEALWVGEAAVRQALNRLADCVSSGRWPGYGPAIHRLKISDWRTKHLHDIDFLEVA